LFTPARRPSIAGRRNFIAESFRFKAADELRRSGKRNSSDTRNVITLREAARIVVLSSPTARARLPPRNSVRAGLSIATSSLPGVPASALPTFTSRQREELIAAFFEKKSTLSRTSGVSTPALHVLLAPEISRAPSCRLVVGTVVGRAMLSTVGGAKARKPRRRSAAGRESGQCSGAFSAAAPARPLVRRPVAQRARPSRARARKICVPAGARLQFRLNAPTRFDD
jgi:hypothetical protein